jgi:3,4-dihydroxy 2-butanone 4-phosphate synthase
MYGGGLICVAIHPLAADRLGLPFMIDLLRNAGLPASMIEKSGDIPYDNRSSFSIWVNHRDTFTGITDNDRALTIRRIGEVVDLSMRGIDVDFGSEFRSPGHVSLLIAAEKLTRERRGQTELSVALAIMAKVIPAMTICEMLDGENGRAYSKNDAKRYALEHRMPFVEGWEIVEEFSESVNDVWSDEEE